MKNLFQGASGPSVHLLQEWLCLQNILVAIDGDFGPATAAAVRRFQEAHGIMPSGRVDQKTWTALMEPLQAALKPIKFKARRLRPLIVAYAKQHLKQRPREVGGENRGPWVRLYTRGLEGEKYPWCAGFVSFIVKQACDTLKVKPPLSYTLSCDALAGEAKKKGLYVTKRDKIKPGSIFLVQRSATDWTHAGFVTRIAEDHFETIEGNTNDEGGREGYEVCARIRGWEGKGFLKLS